ncbi:MAG: YHS domain protein [Acetobacteraceae bacterium]|nr:YHS domain protein [Acetobacteraceae bacterium]
MPTRRALLGFLALPAAAHAADPPHRVFAERGVAIRGYDPVAYFTDGRPVRGRPEFHHAWHGATWHFTSAAHRDRFAAHPTRYAPAYGGFCAWAVSEGYTAPIDPNAWRIVDGRLFLNYDRSVQRRWEADMPARISRADTNWPAVERGVAR